MRKVITGHALVTKNGQYLVFEQTGNTDIEVIGFDDPDYATLFTFENAKQEKYHMLSRTGAWDYHFIPSDAPEKIVKITKEITIEEVSG
ncbi:hypothetical protein PQE66_gp065 [Bacillus phage PBC2]|uniref:Uncharacterized protein n=1 Tax=Bacillus phage PBC2 TaxID=1675029 RepID=A0A218KBV5_9CAUD|nr:hypothetical protein PQE66_gp065 [Bacillus phage PBC2]AKQ08380.1 hypothetical protein PBC2_065 [Bacillus phage PBC2]